MDNFYSEKGMVYIKKDTVLSFIPKAEDMLELG